MPKRHNGRRGVTPEEIKQKVSGVDRPHRDVFMGWLAKDDIATSFERSKFDLFQWDLGRDQRLVKEAYIRTNALMLPESRNDLARLTLANGQFQWLFMVDSDMGFAPDTLDRMLAVADPEKRPVIGALCFAMRELGVDGMGGMQTFPTTTIMQWSNLHQDDGEERFVGVSHYPINKLMRTGATGAACILIHRSVLEKVMGRFGATWFDRVPDPQPGRFMGEDVSFCWRLKELDIPLYIHTGIRTTHMKTVWLGEDDYWQAYAAPPAEERVDVVVPYFGGTQAEANIPLLSKSLRASTGLANLYFVVDPEEKHTRARGLMAIDGASVIEHGGGYADRVNFAYKVLNSVDPAPWFMAVDESARFRPGWLDKAQEVAKIYGASAIGTNDLLDDRVRAGETSHMVLLRRSYVDEHGGSWDGAGSIFYEGYATQLMHEELVNAGKLRGQYQAASGAHIEKVYAAVPEDENQVRADGLLFQRRLAEELAKGGHKDLVRVVGLPEREPSPQYQEA